MNNAILFIDLLEADLTRQVPPYIEPERIARYAQVTLATGSGEGAQALAWYAYNSCQYDAALEWFQRAVAWFPKEATVYGYALALRRQKRQKTTWRSLTDTTGCSPRSSRCCSRTSATATRRRRRASSGRRRASPSLGPRTTAPWRRRIRARSPGDGCRSRRAPRSRRPNCR